MIARGLCLLILAAIALAGSALAATQPRDDARFFNDQVAPILTRHCLGCHNHELDDGNISFEDRATLLKERSSGGAAVIPGRPDDSPLIRAIRHNGDIRMPPGKKLLSRDITVHTEWIRRGAVWGTKLAPQLR